VSAKSIRSVNFEPLLHPLYPVRATGQALDGVAKKSPNVARRLLQPAQNAGFVPVPAASVAQAITQITSASEPAGHIRASLPIHPARTCLQDEYERSYKIYNFLRPSRNQLKRQVYVRKEASEGHSSAYAKMVIQHCLAAKNHARMEHEYSNLCRNMRGCMDKFVEASFVSK
jgi:hypothetical protein